MASPERGAAPEGGGGAAARRARLGRALALALVALTACKPPRSPREAAEGRISGRWEAESAAVGPPLDSGRVVWRLELEERESGKLTGRGTRAHGGTAAGFAVNGLRGEHEITLELKLPDAPARFHGSILSPTTVVGELLLPGDTLPVTFRRE